MQAMIMPQAKICDFSLHQRVLLSQLGAHKGMVEAGGPAYGSLVRLFSKKGSNLSSGVAVLCVRQLALNLRIRLGISASALPLLCKLL
jgi:hypothetical protein